MLSIYNMSYKKIPADKRAFKKNSCIKNPPPSPTPTPVISNSPSLKQVVDSFKGAVKQKLSTFKERKLQSSFKRSKEIINNIANLGKVKDVQTWRFKWIAIMVFETFPA